MKRKEDSLFSLFHCLLAVLRAEMLLWVVVAVIDVILSMTATGNQDLCSPTDDRLVCRSYWQKEYKWIRDFIQERKESKATYLSGERIGGRREREENVKVGRGVLYDLHYMMILVFFCYTLLASFFSSDQSNSRSSWGRVVCILLCHRLISFFLFLLQTVDYTNDFLA